MALTAPTVSGFSGQAIRTSRPHPGFTVLALPVMLWVLFERRARADRLDY